MSTQGPFPDSAISGRRILILDDELLIAADTKALVTRLGGIVLGPYARVRAALEAIQTHPVDGAVLDINVAGVQSFVVAEALEARRVPFVFCTGYGRDSVLPRFQHAPVVEKPLIPELFIAALADALKAGKARAES